MTCARAAGAVPRANISADTKPTAFVMTFSSAAEARSAAIIGLPPHRAPANVLDAEFYTEVVKRPVTSRRPAIVPVQYNASRLFAGLRVSSANEPHCHAGLEGGRIALRIEAQP